MLNQFDLVIFDCDGVLIDSEMLSCDCLRTTLGLYGYPIEISGVFEKFLGRSFSAVAEEYRRALGRALPPDFVAAHRQRLRDSFTASLRTMPAVEEVLDRLSTASCVASSSDGERLHFSLQVAGLAERFAGRVFSADQVAHGKPAPDLFLHAAAAMQAEPRRTLVIEDSPNGVRAGKAAGMHVWGFVGGSHHAASDGSRVLAEAGADRILHHMSELLPA